VFLAKVRDPTGNLTPSDEDKCRKVVIEERTKVGTLSIVVTLDKGKPPTKVPAHRGGRKKCVGRPLSSDIAVKQRKIVLTWSKYPLKTVLKSFREYTPILGGTSAVRRRATHYMFVISLIPISIFFSNVGV
jgi:hypothetical protein